MIHIWGATANGDRAGFDIPVDANGHDESRVPHGLFGFHARAYLPLNGNTVCVDRLPTAAPLKSLWIPPLEW